MKKLHILALVALIAAGCGEKVEEEVFVPDPIGFERSCCLADTTEVKNGETFITMLPRLGLPADRAYELQQICNRTQIFNTHRIVAGNRVTAFYAIDTIRPAEPLPEAEAGRSGFRRRRRKDADTAAAQCLYETRKGPLAYVVYDHDRVHSTVFGCGDSLTVWKFEKPVEHQRKIADVTITSSLWNDMINAGISPLLIVELADIYAWTVNFFALREGDRFRAIYTQSICEGEIFKIDSVDFCIYDSNGVHLPAIRFDQHDGKNKWWNEKGESMRKAFLKAPLKYNRISSRFTYHRRHPVTGKVRPHTAVDYAAPSGTPVHTIGDGVVTMCGWDGSGGGNRIRIRHANGFETCYMHLRGFAKGIRKGVRVSQGQTIGYVGSTGRSTGPHLDFRIWKDKKPLDPLKVISPPAAPLANENLDSLKVRYERYMAEIDSVTTANAEANRPGSPE